MSLQRFLSVFVAMSFILHSRNSQIASPTEQSAATLPGMGVEGTVQCDLPLAKGGGGGRYKKSRKNSSRDVQELRDAWLRERFDSDENQIQSRGFRKKKASRLLLHARISRGAFEIFVG